jgi:hypothetical protein
MHQNSFDLPLPSKDHATCAWCRHSFTTIVQLLEHVELDHAACAAAA